MGIGDIDTRDIDSLPFTAQNHSRYDSHFISI